MRVVILTPRPQSENESTRARDRSTDTLSVIRNSNCRATELYRKDPRNRMRPCTVRTRPLAALCLGLRLQRLASAALASDPPPARPVSARPAALGTPSSRECLPARVLPQRSADLAGGFPFFQFSTPLSIIFFFYASRLTRSVKKKNWEGGKDSSWVSSASSPPYRC
jgi:hypothetical protein